MTDANPRFIGVAKVPGAGSGAPGARPRAVIDLTGGRLEPSEPPVQAPLVQAQPGQAQRSQVRRAVKAPTTSQPIVAAKRRRPGLRRLELTAWVATLGVLAAMGMYVAFRSPEAASWITAAPVDPAVPAYATASPPAVCIFDCGRPPLTGAPTRVRIPAIGVDSPLERLSLDANRRLVPPSDYDEAGWFADSGIAPGDLGAAVLAGHVDSTRGPAVFFRLHQLKRGDVIQVSRGGTVVTFTVTEVEQYPKNRFPTDKVYRPTPDAQLRVITCGGDFDRGRLTYRDNIVVYAVAGTVATD